MEIALVFAILVAAMVVFALDLLPIDFVAFVIMAVTLVLGPVLKLKPEDAISGFSNPATITVLAMFILSGALYRTGVINQLTRPMIRMAGESEFRQLLILALIVGSISAFIANTAVVAIFLPLVLTLARERRRAPSKLLIPLSYVAQLGGVITLIGTSTNVLASALSERAGFGALGMFEFAKIGLLIFATGVLYLLLIGRRLLPERRTEFEITDSYRVKDYLAEVIILPDSLLEGKTLFDSRLSDQYDIDVLEILRGGQKLMRPLGNKVLRVEDILFIRASTDQLLKIKEAKGLAIEPESRWGNQESKGDRVRFMEVVLGRNSELIGGTLESTNFRNRYNCTVIAMQKHGALIRERLGSVRLDFGDTLLLQGERSAFEQIKRESGFIVTEEVQPEGFRTKKIPVALAIMAGVVILAALGQPILVTSIVGCVLMVLTGCLTVNELHESIRWDVIFLLAGIIPLGLAMEKTGAAELLANLAVQSASSLPPVAVLVIFYFISMVITALISNNAAVVLMVPVGVSAAQMLGFDPKAFILAIMFAASADFSTPVGYQTNTMVYGPGGYKFLDFTRVGGPLNLLLALATPIYIYLLWGLYPK
ncbi:MAG: hypothetical protein A2Z21_03955 [Candidatus Fraserbacteria bacterium RBG_16_55_9]|uniref:RCK C-terminal domain-containing protein n=1 Tax=Fraserbacteria sp. (strain RBG_16_55_9) TaxID=1817864 RepID=A0A1F5UYV1_FRAXR|nr:MAG: hypothetical protein A2Z21_03955 [Candidatus Fraserbacteria bacterium RBG_16_55_9]